MCSSLRALVVGVLVPSLLLLGMPSYAQNECGEATESLAAFDQAWRDSFPVIPGPLKLAPWLNHQLGPIGRSRHLAFQKSLILALEKVYAERVAASSLDAASKTRLTDALSAAVADLRRDLADASSDSSSGAGGSGSDGTGGNDGNGKGGGSSGGGRGGFSNEDALVGAIQTHLRKTAFRQCVAQTSLLLFVSTTVTTGGALLVNWKRYAKGDRGLLSVLVTPDSWKKALGDPDFRHNLTWNTILMTTLGSMTCLSNKSAGRNVITAVSTAASVSDQYFTTGTISVRQTLVDALFVRYLSFWKTSKALQFSRQYAARGLAYPKLFEGSLQAISEMIGAFGYPMATNYSKWAWAEAENFLGSFVLFKRQAIEAPEVPAR